MKQIFNRIRLTILFFLFVISIFVFFGIYRPLTDELEQEVMGNFNLVASNKHQVFEAYLMSTRYNAASLSSRSVIRDMLADYVDGKVDFEDLVEYSAPRYGEGVAVFDQLRSALRVTKDGLVIHKIGPDNNMADLVLWDEETLISRYIPEEKLLMVQSPVKKGDVILAYDVILTDASQIIAAIEEEIYTLAFLDEKREDEAVIVDGVVTSYIKCELLGGSISISADESNVFRNVHALSSNVHIRYYMGLIIMFLIIQFLIVRYIRGFIITQEELKTSVFLEKELSQSTLLSVGDGVISTDSSGQIGLFNPVAETLTGWNKNLAIGRNIDEIIKLIDIETRKLVSWGDLIVSEGQPSKSKGEPVLLVTYLGKEIPILESVTPIHLPNGEITGFVTVFRDMTEVFEKQKKIEYMSFHDELTGLYNRRYMENSLHRIDTYRNLPITIMTMDLNNLKLTNDVFGHELGDTLIKKTADFLRSIFRADDLICRIGGDEFCIIMPKTSAEAAESIRDRIYSESSLWLVEPMHLSIAVGYAVKNKKSEKIEDILKASDLDMYQNKQQTRQQCRSITIESFLDNNSGKFDAEMRHNSRVANYASALYEAMGKTPAEVSALRKAIRVHDIGKIVVPGEILNKKETLTPDELELIRHHPQAGYQILRVLKGHEAFADAILYHHERIDGKGYPEGLSGDSIPLESRVIAVADAYEAMTSDRPYRKSLSKEEAVEELKKHSGTQFDSSLVEIFINMVLPNIS